MTCWFVIILCRHPEIRSIEKKKRFYRHLLRNMIYTFVDFNVILWIRKKHINLHLSKFSYFLYIMINKGLAASTIRMKISFNTAKNYDWVKASTSRKGGLTWTCDTSKEFNKLFILEKTINNHLSKLSVLYVYKKNVRNTFVGVDFGKPDQTYHNYSIRFLASSENLISKRTP